MKKSTEKSESFKRRVARHSLTGFGRGFCDVLPKNAIRMEFERRNIREIVDVLRSEVRRLKQDIERQPKGSTEWRRLLDCYCVAKGKLGNIEAQMRDIRGKTWAEVYSFIAELVLHQDTHYYLRDATHWVVKHLQQEPTPPTPEADGIMVNVGAL